MPKVHCIKRRWLEQHKLVACLRQAERIKNGSDQNNDVDDVVMTANIPPSRRGNSSPKDIDRSLAASPGFVRVDDNIDHSSPLLDKTDGIAAITSGSSVVSDNNMPSPIPFNTSTKSAFTRKVSTDTQVMQYHQQERNKLMWKGEEKEMGELLQHAFMHSGQGQISTANRWSALKLHAIELKSSFIECSEFSKWWADVESYPHQLPRESVSVMKSYCMHQQEMQRYRQSLAVLVPEGTLGISLASDNDETIVKEVRKSSVLATKVCPGDKIMSIDGEDVSQMDETEISTMLALWHSGCVRKLEIQPSLASCMPFTNPSKNCSQLHSNFKTQLIYEGVKAYITTNRMPFNEVRVLLRQPVSLLSNRVGVKLVEIKEEEANLIWSEAKEHIATWFTSILDRKCQPSYDALPACNAVQPPRNRRWGQPNHEILAGGDDQPTRKRRCRWGPPIHTSTKPTELYTHYALTSRKA
mmetsp:Transcript_30752/g.61856  ORF Transcript_30752/g.61856 Transcript_30752/m.61856 type:complete len:469 (+) Transcript_30752:78-1484(+)